MPRGRELWSIAASFVSSEAADENVPEDRTVSKVSISHSVSKETCDGVPTGRDVSENAHHKGI